MNYFLKLRFTKWTIIVLLIILLAVFGTLLYFKLDKDQSRTVATTRHERFGEMLKKELSLTPVQEKKFKIFRLEYQQVTKPVFDSLSKKRIAMINELSKSHPDTVILYRISDEIGMLHSRLKRETVNNILKMKSICTPEQLGKFNSLNQRLIGPEGPMHRRGNNQRDDPRHGR